MTAGPKHDVSRADWTYEQLCADPTTTLSQAKGWSEVRFKQGAPCPCCRQYVRRYDRSIYASVARGLIEMYQWGQQPGNEDGWLSVSKHFLKLQIGAARGGDIIKTRYFGLIEKNPHKVRRADGSKRTGLWRLTSRGKSFVLNQQLVPKFARVYNNKFLGFIVEDTVRTQDFDEAMSLPDVEKVGILDTLGEDFNYQTIMSQPYKPPPTDDKSKNSADSDADDDDVDDDDDHDNDDDHDDDHHD